MNNSGNRSAQKQGGSQQKQDKKGPDIEAQEIEKTRQAQSEGDEAQKADDDAEHDVKYVDRGGRLDQDTD